MPASVYRMQRRTLVGGETYGAGFNFSSVLRFIGGAVKSVLGLPVGQPQPISIPGPLNITPQLPTRVTPMLPVPVGLPGAAGAIATAVQLVQSTAQSMGISLQDALDILVPAHKIGASIAAQVAKALGVDANGQPLHAPRGGHHRRINPLNPKALSRAGRRVEAFTKIARRYVTCHHGVKHVSTHKRRK